jgi:hypothetical protein
VAEALPAARCLRELNLSQNNITDGCCALLAEAIRLSALEQVQLHHNCLGPAAINGLIQAQVRDTPTTL